MGAIRIGESFFGSGAEFFTVNRTFFGPILWFFTYKHFGLFGLRAVNIVIFVSLFTVQYFLGRGRYGFYTLILALFLFSFYAGTNINIAAGEQDDNMAALLFSLGVLLYLTRGRVILPSLLIGTGFLFKFSTGIFYLGFLAYLIIRRERKSALLSCLAILTPFLFINIADNFNSMHKLAESFLFQTTEVFLYWGWKGVVYKMFTTGMLLFFLISLCGFLKERNDANLLFFIIPSAYLCYTLISGDVTAAGYLMMQCMLFWSFLIAEFLLKNEYFGRGVARRFIIGAVLILYLVIMKMISLYNIGCDTITIKGVNKASAGSAVSGNKAFFISQKQHPPFASRRET
jgi:hypothetical protein